MRRLYSHRTARRLTGPILTAPINDFSRIAARPQTPCRLLLQLRSKVRYYRDRLAHLLRDAIKENFLAVRGNVVKDLRGGPITNQGLSDAELQCATRVLHRHREKIVGGIHVVELFAVLV